MHLNRLPTLRVIGKWSIFLILGIPLVANAQVFQSSRTGDRETITLPIPLGAVVYKADEKEVSREVRRTIGCAELYDTPHDLMYYEGGPIVQRRFEIELAVDEMGEFIKDEDDEYQKSYSRWEKESGVCLQYHIERRTRSCPSTQFGEYHDKRVFYYKDTLTSSEINTSSRLGDTGWVQVANTCLTK